MEIISFYLPDGGPVTMTGGLRTQLDGITAVQFLATPDPCGFWNTSNYPPLESGRLIVNEDVNAVQITYNTYLVYELGDTGCNNPYGEPCNRYPSYVTLLRDNDGDGYPQTYPGLDCDDNDPLVHPGLPRSAMIERTTTAMAWLTLKILPVISVR
jgi:hypothetical protein